MWWRIKAFVPALVVGGLVSAGCHLAEETLPRCPAAEGCSDGTAVQPVCEDRCVEIPEAGFTGPHWFWLGAPADLPPCPDTAPLDGLRAYADASPAVDPPCAATQSVQWGFVARECKIPTHDTCTLPGTICAPSPPDGYALCIYQDDEAPCPDGYPTRHRLMRENPDEVCSGTGIEPVTLCCEAAGVPG